MSQKINDKIKNSVLTSLESNAGLKYKKSNFNWGLDALLEDEHLVFKDHFDNNFINKKRKWRKFIPFSKSNPKQIVTNTNQMIDVYCIFSEDAKKAWQRSYLIAQQRGETSPNSEDIFLSLLKEPEVQQIFARVRVSLTTVEVFLNNYLELSPSADSSTEIKKIPFAAFAEASKLHAPSISPLLLLAGLLIELPYQHVLQSIYANIGLSIDKLEILTIWQLKLNHDFPPNSTNGSLLRCCQQVELLEELFKYYFEYAAIETALKLNPKNPTSLLVKAGLGAKTAGAKIITEESIKKLAKNPKNL